MHLGYDLFEALGSPFKKISNIARWILLAALLLTPVLFHHLLMDYVHVETAHITAMFQHWLVQLQHENYVQPLPTKR